MKKPTQSRLKALFHYDPDTGLLTRLVSTAPCVKPGDIAGCDNGSGYLKVDVDGTKYYVHRLIWLYMTGAHPIREIDHKDMDRSNNRWSNLRLARRDQNAANAKLSKSNTSGFKGVSWNPRRENWRSYAWKDRKQIWIGSFASERAAAEAAAQKRRELFGPYAR